MWGKKGSAPMLQALHFSFAFGAFLAPLLTAPFLADVSSNSTVVTAAPSNPGSRRLLQADPQVLMLSSGDIHRESRFNLEGDTAVRLSEIGPSRVRRNADPSKQEEETHTTESLATSGTMTTHDSTGTSPTVSPSAHWSTTAVPEVHPTTHHTTKAAESRRTKKKQTDKKQETTVPASTTTRSPSTRSASVTTEPALDATTLASKGFQTQVERFMLPYLIIGVFVLLTSMLFFYFLCTAPKGEPRHSGSGQQEDGDDTKKCTFHLRVMFLLFVFYFLYVGAEVSYGGFVASFAVESSLQFSQDRAALVVSVFWGTFTLGRGLAICLASVVSPLRMIIFDLVGAVAACVVLSLVGDSNEVALWAGTSLLGLSMASLFPSGIAWLQTYTRVTGNAASLLVVGSALGEMVVPLVISSLFTWISDKGYMFLMYIMLAITLFCAAIFVYVVHLAADTGQEKQSTPAKENHAVKIYQDIKMAIPMEDLSVNGVNGKPAKQMGSTLIPHKLKPKNHKE